jgi:hypothetical protein
MRAADQAKCVVVDDRRRPRRHCIGALASLLACLLCACVTVKPVVVDRKTQLENQMLGTFQRLEDDLILASSVRGERREARLSGLEREAVEAMMTREFQRDDVDALKSKQAVGEARTGMLAVLTPPSDEAEAKRVKQLVAEENRCRQVLLRRVIALGPDLSDKDLPELQRVLYRLNVQIARPGDRVQGEDGAWRAVVTPPAKP